MLLVSLSFSSLSFYTCLSTGTSLDIRGFLSAKIQLAMQEKEKSQCVLLELVLGHYKDQGYTEGSSFFLLVLVRHYFTVKFNR